MDTVPNGTLYKNFYNLSTDILFLRNFNIIEESISSEGPTLLQSHWDKILVEFFNPGPECRRHVMDEYFAKPSLIGRLSFIKESKNFGK